jgi:hypothetical protein
LLNINAINKEKKLCQIAIIVDPGFNSGWLSVQGWWPVENAHQLPPERGYFGDKMVTIPNNVETFADKGKYSSPEFAWNMSV